MDNFLGVMNRELSLELFEVKQQLRILEKQLQNANSKQSQEVQLTCQVSQLTNQLRNAEDRISVQDSIINDLRSALSQLHIDNLYLVRQNEFLMLQSEPKIENILNIPEAEKIPAAEPPLDYAKVLVESPGGGGTPGTSNVKTSAIAKKLGLTEKNPSPKKEPESAPTEMRLFVGHLSSSIDKDALKKYFSKFGDIVDIFYPNDASGKSRGFAFVTFGRLFGIHPLEIPHHSIDDREIYLDVSQYKHGEGEPTQTILASGIIYDSTDEAITKHFSKYGKVLGIVRPKESRRKCSRWAFIHYADCNSADKALADPVHTIDGHVLDLRRALDFHYYSKREGKVEKTVTKQETVTKINAVSTNIPNESKSSVVSKIPANSNHEVNVKKLLIHNLDLKTTTETIRKYFSKFGTVVDAYIPTEYGTNNSKGFGYIVMPANEVNFNFRSHIIDNRCVHISKEGTQLSTEKTSTILVSAGPEVMAKVSEQDLMNFFSRFGKIASVRKPLDTYSKKSSHYGFVEFTTCDAVEKALAHMAYKINGQILCITKSRFEPHK